MGRVNFDVGKVDTEVNQGLLTHEIRNRNIIDIEDVSSDHYRR